MTKGVPPQAGSGHSAKPEPCCTVSAETASVPNALIERMQGLSFSLAMGGLEETDPAKLLDRIEEGVELIQRVETMRAAEIVEEMSKLPASWGMERITWGKVKAAILARCAVDPVRYQNGGYGITPEQLFPSGSKLASADRSPEGGDHEDERHELRPAGGSTQCPHSDLHFNLNNASFGNTNLHYLEVTAKCTICNTEMVFCGPTGINPEQPACSLDGKEIRLPFLGEGETLTGKPIGYSVSFKGTSHG